jgi:hypothetical protein
VKWERSVPRAAHVFWNATRACVADRVASRQADGSFMAASDEASVSGGRRCEPFCVPSGPARPGLGCCCCLRRGLAVDTPSALKVWLVICLLQFPPFASPLHLLSRTPANPRYDVTCFFWRNAFSRILHRHRCAAQALSTPTAHGVLALLRCVLWLATRTASS